MLQQTLRYYIIFKKSIRDYLCIRNPHFAYSNLCSIYFVSSCQSLTITCHAESRRYSWNECELWRWGHWNWKHFHLEYRFWPSRRYESDCATLTNRMKLILIAEINANGDTSAFGQNSESESNIYSAIEGDNKTVESYQHVWIWIAGL